jgi:hypothetical protein
MGYNLFLDDYRQPQDAFKYTRNEIFLTEKWIVVKNYHNFCKVITKMGLPDMIAFDHDLSDAHYQYQTGQIDYNSMNEKTGYHCAKWLIEFIEAGTDKRMPKYLCHSMNPVGKENILSLLSQYDKYFNKEE